VCLCACVCRWGRVQKTFQHGQNDFIICQGFAEALGRRGAVAGVARDCPIAQLPCRPPLTDTHTHTHTYTHAHMVSARDAQAYELRHSHMPTQPRVYPYTAYTRLLVTPSLCMCVGE
jgi:hypothetical protein